MKYPNRDNPYDFFIIFSVANSSTDPKEKEDNEIDSSYDMSSDGEDDIYVRQQVQRYKKPGTNFQLRPYF